MGNILYTRRPPYYLRMFKCLLMQMSYLPIRIEKQGDLRDFGRGMVFRVRQAAWNISEIADLLEFS